MMAITASSARPEIESAGTIEASRAGSASAAPASAGGFSSMIFGLRCHHVSQA